MSDDEFENVSSDRQDEDDEMHLESDGSSGGDDPSDPNEDDEKGGTVAAAWRVPFSCLLFALTAHLDQMRSSSWRRF